MDPKKLDADSEKGHQTGLRTASNFFGSISDFFCYAGRKNIYASKTGYGAIFIEMMPA
jgi:hypothetical protein